MNSETIETKARIRREIAERDAQFAKESMHGKFLLDLAVCGRIGATEVYRRASSVVFFISDGIEPDLRLLMERARRARKKIYLPRYNSADGAYEIARVRDFERDLVPGKFGFPEPRPEARTLDAAPAGRTLMLLPGVAFDMFGRRLGRGRGFYDRMLEAYNVTALGVFFEYRRVERLPDEAHDRHLDLAVTEAGATYF